MSGYMNTAKTCVWETPKELFDMLDKRFHFTLDPCALPENAKCEKFFTPEDDGLSQNWGGTACSAIRRMAARLLTG